MRSRTIKPSLFVNEDLAEISIYARYLFTGLWCLADREGRLEDRPKQIKAKIYPYENVEIEPLLEELARAKSIRRYEAAGEKVILIVNFKKHQKIHQNENPSVLPPEPQGNALDTQGLAPLEQGLAPLEQALAPLEQALAPLEQALGTKSLLYLSSLNLLSCIPEEETPPTPPSGGSPGEPEFCETVPADETALEPEPPEPDNTLTLPETARLEAAGRAQAVKLLPILAALYAETLAREGWKPFALLNKRESHTGSLMRNIFSDSARSDIEFWRGHVNRIRGSGFHMGRVPDKAGEYFKSRNFEWFLALKNVDNVAGWVLETPAAKSPGQRTYEALKDEVWE